MTAPDRPAARRAAPARIFRLGEEPADDDLSALTTAEQRLEMVAELSRRMWELTGRATRRTRARRSPSASSAAPDGPVTDDWFDLLAALLDAGARFLVVGAHALAVHGVPRGTQDLDV